MNGEDPQLELLARYLDGRANGEEQRRVVEWLRSNPRARSFLREVAEQAVLVADIERIAAGRAEALQASVRGTALQPGKIVPGRFRNRASWAAAAAGLVLLAALANHFLQPAQTEIARVTKVTGASQCFSARGGAENPLAAGASIRAGDTLETRSCDGWIELRLRDGSIITVAGHSTLRILDAASGSSEFKLLQGSLWGSPPTAGAKPLVIQTPAVTAEVRDAQFDLQTSSTATMLRVNSGAARVTRTADGRVVEVPRGNQMTASLGAGPLSVTAQREPIDYWACDLWRVPEVILGRWLPPVEQERARLGAEPLLWPIAGGKSLMLYAAAIAAWKSTDHPVLLQAGSTLRFRGRTERAQTVRFGFSAQKMRGVFAGKFEVDVPPAALAPAGEVWEVELPLSGFRPLHPQLASSPAGLELTDVYALTLREDAGLEIHHIELAPAQER